MAKAKYIGGAVRYEPNPPDEGGQRPLFYVSSPKDDEDRAEAEIQKLVATRARKQRMAELGISEDQISGKTSTERSEPNPKRYLVDQETGRIDVAPDGDGEYTYKDALLVSASIKGKTGQFDDAVSLINAAKALSEGSGPKTEDEKTKEFWVDEGGTIYHDPENGELTLSEARAVSQSRQRALVSRSEDVITPDKLELMKRDLRDEITGRLGEELREVKRGLTPAESEAPFSISSNGGIEMNPKAKLSLSDYFLYELIKREKNPLYKDAQGNTLPLPEYLEVGRFHREEERKDQRNAALVGLFETGKKELPPLIAALKNIAPSKEAEGAMEKGGWSAKGEPKTGLKTSHCPQCGEEISYVRSPSLVNCPKCKELVFFGTPEQLKEIRERFGGEPRREESSTSSEAMDEGTSEQLGGEPRTEEQESPTSSEATDEATSREP